MRNFPAIHRCPLEFARLPRIAALTALCFAHGIAAKIDVPIFLFSGQSNMVGLGASVEDLSTEQRKASDNVKIYLDAEGDASQMKKWLALGPGFGANSSGFGPELLFGKVLSDSMPGRKMAFIKVARSGTYLGKTNEWLPPSSNNGTGGPYYQGMMASIDAALKSFHSAFDTSLYSPKWAGFLWLQGESDAMEAALADKYEVNLANLIKDIRKKTEAANLPVIIPMIDQQAIWTHNAKVRAADIAVKTVINNVDTMDTKGLPTDGIHYKAAGMVSIGQRSALRWLKMKYLSPSVSIAHRSKSRSASIHVPLAFIHGGRRDIIGRRVPPSLNPH